MTEMTYNERMELVKRHHPHARVVFHPGEDVFVLYTGDDADTRTALSSKYAWQSQCWFEASERILVEQEREELARDGRQLKVLGAIGYGLLK